MTNCTNRHQCKITFRWDDGDETRIIDIYTPEDITDKEVNDALKSMHDKLNDDEESDVYGTAGRCPETLAAELCEERGWIWRVHEDSENDIEIALD